MSSETSERAGTTGPAFSAVVMGEESLLIQCVEILHDRGHRVAAIVTGSDDIRVWAETAGIPSVPNDQDLADALRSHRFDHLFSITNLTIIPDAVTSQARGRAINFHDGPLPAYAGLYATSWAILNGEDRHGVTWHTIESGIDEGAILQQRVFDIADDETAFTLNVKCYEHAISSFASLVDDLAAGSAVGTPQDPSLRSYFGRYLRPEAAATIDWTRPAVEIGRLVRALDFGSYENPLGLAKLLLAGEIFVVRAVTVSADDNGTEAGIVLELDGPEATISTSAGTVTIESLIGPDLLPQSASEVLTEYGVAVGDRLPLLDHDLADRLTELNGEICRREASWVADLRALEAIEVPYARAATGSSSTDVEVSPLVLPPEVSAHVGRAERPGDLLIGGFACYLARLTGQDRFHLSLSVSLDHGSETCRAWFAPRVPLLCAVPGDRPFGQAIDDLIAGIEATRARSTHAVDLRLRYPELAANGHVGPGLPLSVGVEVHATLDRVDTTARTRPDLVLAVTPTGDAVWIRDTSVYPADVLARIENEFRTFLASAVDRPDAPSDDNPLLTDDELHRMVVEWNDTAKAVDTGHTVHESFMTRAKLAPSPTAVVCRNRSITYAELDERSNQLAHQLQEMGAGPGRRVGVFMDRGLDMIVGLLGILKSGAAYVPLDPDYPADRISFMIADAELTALITHTTLDERLPDHPGGTLRLDADQSLIENQPRHAVDVTSAPDDLAYVIYTSGSTGTPKGVMVTHRNVVNFLAGMDDHIDHDEGDTWLTVTSLSFDISVLEIFWSLTRGLRLVVHTEGRDSAGGPDVAVLPHSHRPIGFSLFYFASDESEPGTGQKYELLLEGARFADANGFEAVWTPERHFHAFGGLYPNPAVSSAAIAAITRNVKIRAGSCVLPLHHPVRVAEDWAVVDNIADGRVGIAFAAGWQPVDFVLRPENFEDRKGALVRDIEVVRRLWRGDTLTMDGPTGPVEIRTLPRPVQPELPVWITVAGNPDTFALAGAGGFNVLTHLLGQTMDELAEKVEAYRQARREAGHVGPGHVTLMLHSFVGDDLETIRDIVREPMIEYLRSSVTLIKEAAWSFPTFQQKSRESGKSPMELFDEEDLSDDEMDALLEHAFNRYFEGSALFGTPDSCLPMVDELKRIGIDEIACQVDFGLGATEVLAHLPGLEALRRRSQPVEVDDHSIAGLIERHDVSHFQCTPSMGTMLLADDRFRRAAAGLKMCLMGGEAFPQTLAKEITDVVGGRVLNVYGPTETTIWSSVHEVENGDLPVSIGRPLANQQMYVVDRRLRPVPIGVPGELLIGGDGVTDGYLHRPDLTDERFVPDHFRVGIDAAKLYRTGDLVRYSADGSIDFLGRMDFQVKVRGYRIELGEIETLLERHPSVRDAVVTAREDVPGDQRLVAYLVASTGSGFDGDVLREHLGRHLPEFMVPTQYVALDSFPLTPNRKIDRKALPRPEQSGVSARAVYAAPESSAQEEIAAIWQELLGMSRVGVRDNFFDLGGHSLLAVQLHRRVREVVDAELSITDVFRFPTIESLTAHLADRDGAAAAAEHRVAERAAARRDAMSNRRSRRRK